MAKNQNVDPNEEEREEMTVTLTLDDDTELGVCGSYDF